MGFSHPRWCRSSSINSQQYYDHDQVWGCDDEIAELRHSFWEHTFLRRFMKKYSILYELEIIRELNLKKSKIKLTSLKPGNLQGFAHGHTSHPSRCCGLIQTSPTLTETTLNTKFQKSQEFLPTCLKLASRQLFCHLEVCHRYSSPPEGGE